MGISGNYHTKVARDQIHAEMYSLRLSDVERGNEFDYHVKQSSELPLLLMQILAKPASDLSIALAEKGGFYSNVSQIT